MAETADLRRRVAVARELALRAGDPLLKVLAQRTAAQLAFINSQATIRLLEGGNRSGKTETNICDGLLQARRLHPKITWKPLYPGDRWQWWYATVTYELFATQGWKHFKHMLLYPGEDVHRLPTRNILAIGWLKKNPETPNFIVVRAADGSISEIWIKSYDQGVGTFQSGGINLLSPDEESPDQIFQEGRFRILERSGRINVSATPILGMPWLAKLRAAAERHEPGIEHFRLSMLDNPAIPPTVIDQIKAQFKDHPELLRLRLEGYPMAMEGLVYNDKSFTSAHVCRPFDIPGEWTRRRVIDYGFNHTACLWAAVSKDGARGVIYRDYKGREQTIEQNCAEIIRRSGGETYADTWIDPATLGSEGVDGKRVIDHFIDGGLDCAPAARGPVMAGIEEVWKLLSERGPGTDPKSGISGTQQTPRFQVFDSCTEFLDERRTYKWPDAREQTIQELNRDEADGIKLKPVKRDDHCMDCWRYWVVSGGMIWAPPPRPAPPPLGTKARRMWDIRMNNQ